MTVSSVMSLSSFQEHIILLDEQSPNVNLLLKMAIPGLVFFIFVFSIQQIVNVQDNFLPMTGWEPRTSGVAIDRSTNWATTTTKDYDTYLICNVQVAESFLWIVENRRSVMKTSRSTVRMWESRPRIHETFKEGCIVSCALVSLFF